MKAIVMRRPGDPSVLEYVDVPTPLPGRGDVLVKADTIGVRMPEVLVRKGTYAWMPPLPAIPGIEMSGTIAACGDGVAGRSVGEAVFVSARDLPVRAGGRIRPLIHARLPLADAGRAQAMLEAGEVVGKLLLKP